MHPTGTRRRAASVSGQRGAFACFSATRELLVELHEELGLLMGGVMPEEALAAAEPCET